VAVWAERGMERDLVGSGREERRGICEMRGVDGGMDGGIDGGNKGDNGECAGS